MSKNLAQQSHTIDWGKGDRSFLDILPGYWMWRQDPTIETLVHNHDVAGGVVLLVGASIWSYAVYMLLGRINRLPSRPLFVVNKKTWFNTKVPRKRARKYDRQFMKPPED